MIRVVCWKWDGEFQKKKGDAFKFGAEHVNRLYSMVKRHLHIPFEFCCITDEPKGIVEDVRIIPLWEDLRGLGGCYVRLKAFAPEMAEIIGPRFVWMDLDTVILRDITPIIDRPEDFVMWGDTNPTTPYNGSMVLMNAGARRQVWDKWDQDSIGRAMRLGYVGTDQAHIGAVLGTGEAMWTRKDGVYSFRCHIKREQLLRPPNDARIVFFHGSNDPSQEWTQDHWPWVREHWR